MGCDATGVTANIPAGTPPASCSVDDPHDAHKQPKITIATLMDIDVTTHSLTRWISRPPPIR